MLPVRVRTGASAAGSERRDSSLTAPRLELSLSITRQERGDEQGDLAEAAVQEYLSAGGVQRNLIEIDLKGAKIAEELTRLQTVAVQILAGGAELDLQVRVVVVHILDGADIFAAVPADPSTGCISDGA